MPIIQTIFVCLKSTRGVFIVNSEQIFIFDFEQVKG